MTIKIMTTGGTIDKVYFDQKSEFAVGESRVGEILKEANITVDYDIESIIRKDSIDLTQEDRKMIYDRIASDPSKQIVVTHGTDTMVETGCKLKSIKGKTIVLTGSMQPARFHLTDALFNIASAMTAVQLLPEGVYIAINGNIFDPAKVRKNREELRFEPIDS